jgi:hypothetical protein
MGRDRDREREGNVVNMPRVKAILGCEVLF